MGSCARRIIAAIAALKPRPPRPVVFLKEKTYLCSFLKTTGRVGRSCLQAYLSLGTPIFWDVQPRLARFSRLGSRPRGIAPEPRPAEHPPTQSGVVKLSQLRSRLDETKIHDFTRPSLRHHDPLIVLQCYREGRPSAITIELGALEDGQQVAMT